ncbi:hypothetical protein GmHk_09G024814 [Glycine max]|nr:hypothetical protein GmHk_09G024814 [Glycine max]
MMLVDSSFIIQLLRDLSQNQFKLVPSLSRWMLPTIRSENMDMVNNANSAATSSPSQTQVVVPMASAQFSSPSVELTTSSPPAHVVQMASPQPRHPSRHILENKRTDQVHFVDLLVKLLNPDDLELKNFNGNTAFCYAAASGNLQIASLMIKKNAGLPKIRGGEGATPFYMAALQGKDDMARHLYDLTTGILEEDEWTTLFFLCIKNGLYDIALKMLQEHSMLALERDENNDTALHLLARMPSGFTGHGQWYPPSQILNNSMKPTPFVQLVECLWNKLLEQDYDETEMRTFISVPSQITFDATQVGNFQFVAALMRSYPDLLWEVDDKNRSIIHIAVIHRHSSIYSLIHELGSFKDFIATFEDDEGNNILHYAAKLTPPDKLGLISGAALQMTHELLWFKEVKELMLLLDVEKKNAKGKTPREIFAEEHKELLTKAESWTKSTSISCMLVSTLITAGVFTATFMLPGGIHKKTQTPNFLHKPAFLAFSLSVAFALISASASILMFLSILISSYAEEECFKLLPKRLLIGMVAQIISITNMMVAFSAAFCMSYSHVEMAMAVRNTTNPEELQIAVIHEIASLQGRSPSCDLVNNTRDYANKCAPIYSLAIRGEWKETEAMIDADRRLATSAISQGRATLLHVAAEANQLHFVKELVKLLSDEDLELQDRKGNTAFCLAAASGNVRIVKVMARRNSRLPTIRRGDGLTPLHMAALQGKNKMAWHLYHDTVQTFNDADWDALFFFCLKTDIYDLALKVLREKPRVALARNENQETGLHVLARKPSSFSCR